MEPQFREVIDFLTLARRRRELARDAAETKAFVGALRTKYREQDLVLHAEWERWPWPDEQVALVQNALHSLSDDDFWKEASDLRRRLDVAEELIPVEGNA